MIVRSGAAAELCGIDRTTLYRWACEDAHVRACMFRRGWWVIERMDALGMVDKQKIAARGLILDPTMAPARTLEPAVAERLSLRGETWCADLGGVEPTTFPSMQRAVMAIRTHLAGLRLTGGAA